MLRITYTDTDDRFDPKLDEHYAFLIESQAALVYVFQYLVGNTDWSLVMAKEDDACCHNGDIVDIDSGRFYVPYDFDLSGLVNAGYAYPAPSLRIRKVTQRLYRGFCTERSTLQNALATVKARQAEITKVLTEMPGLPDRGRVQNLDYLGKFFSSADNEEKLISAFEKRCL